VKKTAWSTEEDNILLTAQERLGNKWSEIAKLLPGRAENAVKNRYNSLINRRWTEEMFNNAENAMQEQIYSGAGMGTVPSGPPARSRGRGGGNRGRSGGGGRGGEFGFGTADLTDPFPQQQGGTAPEILSFANLAANVRDSNPDFKTAAPVLDSQEGKLISEIFGTLGKADNVPVIPEETQGGMGGGLGLDLQMPGIKPDPDAEEFFFSGADTGGAAAGMGLVNNPDGWTASAQQQSRALEMTAEFMNAEKVIQPLLLVKLILTLFDLPQERQQLFGGVKISSANFNDIVRKNTSEANARRLGIGLNLDDGNLSPDEAESPRPVPSASPKSFGAGGQKRGRRSGGHSRSISERDNAMGAGGATSSWEWRDKWGLTQGFDPTPLGQIDDDALGNMSLSLEEDLLTDSLQSMSLSQSNSTLAGALRQFNRGNNASASGDQGLKAEPGSAAAAGAGGAKPAGLQLDLTSSFDGSNLPFGMSPTARDLHRVSKDFKEGRISLEQKDMLKDGILSRDA
jgi:hypothetical protein